jgi:hypothetical protein
MKTKIIFLTVFAAVMLSAQSFSRANAPEGGDYSTIYIYVPSHSWHYNIAVLLNDKQLSTINGRFLFIYKINSSGTLNISLKTHEFYCQPFDAQAILTITHGQSYYFSVGVPAFRWDKLKLNQKNKSLGEREVEKEKFKPAKTISLEEDANNPVIPGSN